MIELEKKESIYHLCMNAGENRWNTSFVRQFAEALDEIEKDEILKLLGNFYKLDNDKLNKLFETSFELVDNANDIHQFTSKINSLLTDDEKIMIIEMIWKIVIADGRIDDYENALVRKISGLLYIDDFKVGEIKKKLSQ